MAMIERLTNCASAAPMVAGLVAYIRAHPDERIRVDTPFTVKKRLELLSRTIKLNPDDGEDKVKVAWNGQSGTQTCGTSNSRRGLLGRFFRRQDDGCPVPGPDDPGSGSSRPSSLPQGPLVTFASGPAGPICTASCGHLCSGFWCGPNPTGPPPDLAPSTTSGGSELTGGPLPTLSSPGNDPFPTNCISTTTLTSCLALGGGQKPACVTTSSCAATGAPSPPKTTDPAPEPSHTPVPGPANCVTIEIEWSSLFDTIWYGTLYHDGKKACDGSKECKCNSGDLPCDDGYTLRFESSSQTERDEYLNAYFSAPGSDGEVHWQLPLYSTDTTPCGLPAVQCKSEVFRDSSAGCKST